MSERFYSIDPTNLKHIELLADYNKENGVFTPIGQINKEKIQEDNEFSMELVLERKNKVQDICHLQGVKDIKQCTITFTKKNKKDRKIISLATTYALDILGMEEVFINTNKEDKNTQEYLLNNDYECLGDEKGNIIFLKEKN